MKKNPMTFKRAMKDRARAKRKKAQAFINQCRLAKLRKPPRLITLNPKRGG